MGQLASVIAGTSRVPAMAAEKMLQDIKPSMFARKPVGKDGKVIDTNHPAFVYGHLSLYPARIFKACGLDESKVAAPAGFTELFKAGAECKDDPNGTIYPSMDAIMTAYKRAYEGLYAAIAAISDEQFAKPVPESKFFANIGEATLFTAVGHPMMHLGQVSAWRRCMGLGSVGI